MKVIIGQGNAVLLPEQRRPRPNLRRRWQSRVLMQSLTLPDV